MFKLKWLIHNAVNRDVERQELNKVLGDIRSTVEEVSKSSSNVGGDPRDVIGKMVENNTESGIAVKYNFTKKVIDFIVNNFRITLSGDVTGTAEVQGLSSVTINTTLDPSKVGIGEAPIDANPYWRKDGAWDQVPQSLQFFGDNIGVGFPAQTFDPVEGEVLWNSRTFEADAGELTVINGTGENGNPSYGLATVGDTGVGTKIVDVDEFGRSVGTSFAAYYHSQPSASATWIVNHNLNRQVTVTAHTTGGSVMIAEIISVSLNQAQVLLDEPISGYAVVH